MALVIVERDRELDLSRLRQIYEDLADFNMDFKSSMLDDLLPLIANCTKTSLSAIGADRRLPLMKQTSSTLAVV